MVPGPGGLRSRHGHATWLEIPTGVQCMLCTKAMAQWREHPILPKSPPSPHGKLCQALPSIPAQIPTSDRRQGGHSRLAPPAHHHAQIFLHFSYELLASSAA